MEMPTAVRDVVSVQFQDRKRPELFGGREYTYLTAVPLAVGDIVAVPTKRGTGKARVARIGVTKGELIPGIEYKTIMEKINQEQPAGDAHGAGFDTSA